MTTCEEIVSEVIRLIGLSPTQVMNRADRLATGELERALISIRKLQVLRASGKCISTMTHEVEAQVTQLSFEVLAAVLRKTHQCCSRSKRWWLPFSSSSSSSSSDHELANLKARLDEVVLNMIPKCVLHLVKEELLAKEQKRLVVCIKGAPGKSGSVTALARKLVDDLQLETSEYDNLKFGWLTMEQRHKLWEVMLELCPIPYRDRLVQVIIRNDLLPDHPEPGVDANEYPWNLIFMMSSMQDELTKMLTMEEDKYQLVVVDGVEHVSDWEWVNERARSDTCLIITTCSDQVAKLVESTRGALVYDSTTDIAPPIATSDSKKGGGSTILSAIRGCMRPTAS